LIWIGPVPSNEELRKKYGVDEIYYTSMVSSLI